MSKLAFGSIVLSLAIFGWSTYSMGEQPPAPRGELRIVDTSRYNFVTVVYNVFEHLVDLDAEGNLEPRLATSWRWLDDRTLDMKLRQGVTFHNGEVFDAAIVKLNWDENTRLKQPFLGGQNLNFKPGVRLEIIEQYRVQFHFPSPDGAALIKLSTMHLGNRQFHTDHGWGEQEW